MDKEALLSSIWEEAERIAKDRFRIIRGVLICFVLILSYAFLLFHFYLSPNFWVINSWPLYLLYSVLFSLSFFLPTGKISKERVEKVFHQISKVRAKNCFNDVNNLSEKVAQEILELNALKTVSSLYSEIQKERLENLLEKERELKKELGCE